MTLVPGSKDIVPTPEPAKTPSSSSAPTGGAEARKSGIPTAQTEAGNDREDLLGGYSACGGLSEGETRTLGSIVTDYRYENNRRYHNYGTTPYWGPNDEEANEIQDIGHHIYLLTLDGKLHLAPITQPQRILDLGTGTGIWAIDLAELYPSATVTGTDLSPIQPAFVPDNCSFEIDDLNLKWTYPENHFDFIHVRELFGSVTDWDELFRQMLVHTKPGGWVEVVERSVSPRSDDDTVGPDHPFTLWGNTILECGDKWNKTFRIWEESKRRMIEAGFQNVTEVRFQWPVNQWPKDRRLKELGRWNQLRMHNGLESYAMRLLTMAGGWSYAQAQVFCAEVRNAIKDTKTHAFLDLSIVYGQKQPIP